MHLTVTPRPEGATEVAAFGPLYRRIVADLLAILRDRRSEQVHINLTNCLDVDVDALRAIAVARRVARAHGGDVCLCAVPPLIQDRCRRVHLDHLIEVDNRDDPRHGR